MKEFRFQLMLTEVKVLFTINFCPWEFLWIRLGVYKGRYTQGTRELAPTTRSRNMLPEQSFLVCTNDFMRKNCYATKFLLTNFAPFNQTGKYDGASSSSNSVAGAYCGTSSLVFIGLKVVTVTLFFKVNWKNNRATLGKPPSSYYSKLLKSVLIENQSK